jgi:WD40 repeat protein
VKVTITETAGGELLIGTETGDVYMTPMPTAAKPVIMPSKPAATLPERVSDLAMSADGNLAAATSVVDGSVVLLYGDEGTGSDVFQTEYHSVSISPDGQWLALAGFGVMTLGAKADNPPTHHIQPMLDGGRGEYEDVAFTATGAVAAVSLEGVDVWPLRSPVSKGATRSCGCAARGLRLSDDGRRAIFGTADGHLVIMNVQTGDLLVDRTVSTRHNDIVWAVDFNADGTLAAAVSTDGKVLVWDVKRDATAWRGRVPLKSVERVYFTAEGQALVFESAGVDFGSTNVWWASLEPAAT